MPTSIQLASGLGGAIGCDFRTTQNQLIFVEYSTGKLSSLNLFPPATIVAQGTGTILKGTPSYLISIQEQKAYPDPYRRRWMSSGSSPPQWCARWYL